jgi:hypothetical protein
MTTKTTARDTVQALNDLLQGELAAVQTYNEALTIVDQDAKVREELSECRSSHERRVLRLRTEVLDRGGTPATKPGAWGTFAKLVEKGAKALGSKMAINALEAGEDHGLKEYADNLAQLDTLARSSISTDLYPEQVRTHRIVSALKSQLEQPHPSQRP